MSSKNSYTTSDYIPWDEALETIDALYRDGEPMMSLLIGCGCYFGLRISDIRTLRWNQLLDRDSFVLYEKKTGKRREIRINPDFSKHIHLCHEAMQINNNSRKCFLTKMGTTISTQMINRHLKEYRIRYSLHVNNISTHSLRKTFGRCVVENSTNPEMTLIMLSELFNHSNPMVTRRYLGLRQQELGHIYETLPSKKKA